MKRAEFPAGSRWSAKGRYDKNTRSVTGCLDVETLNWRSARYTEEKARTQAVACFWQHFPLFRSPQADFLMLVGNSITFPGNFSGTHFTFF